MDDIQLLVYILIVAFGIFSRFLKAKKKKPKPQAPADTETASEKPVVSFEELLKEFTGESSNEPELEEVYEPKRAKPKPVAVEYNEDEIQQRYQESLITAESYKSQSARKEEKQDDRHKGNFTHVNGYDAIEKEPEESEFLAFLRDEDGPRKAIILGEILNRRY
ncbi:MAG: hypothetical protein AAF693_14510 [Bacteroidota bacterium]